MKYRRLKSNDVIKEGDQRLIGDTWKNCPNPMFGNFVPGLGHRRPLTPEQLANLFREKLADLMEEFGVTEISCVVDEYYFDLDGSTCDLSFGDPVTPETIRELITSPEKGETENK